LLFIRFINVYNNTMTGFIIVNTSNKNNVENLWLNQFVNVCEKHGHRQQTHKVM